MVDLSSGGIRAVLDDSRGDRDACNRDLSRLRCGAISLRATAGLVRFRCRQCPGPWRVVKIKGRQCSLNACSLHDHPLQPNSPITLQLRACVVSLFFLWWKACLLVGVVPVLYSRTRGRLHLHEQPTAVVSNAMLRRSKLKTLTIPMDRLHSKVNDTLSSRCKGLSSFSKCAK